MEREKDERGKRPEENKKSQDDPSRKGYGQQSQPQYEESTQQHEGVGDAGQDSGDFSSEERESSMSAPGEQSPGRDIGGTEQGRGGKRAPGTKKSDEGGEWTEGSESDREREDLP